MSKNSNYRGKKNYRKNNNKSNCNAKGGKDFEKKERGINESINDDERAIRKQGIRGGRNGNDPNWYALTPQLLSDAGQLSFNNPLGSGLYGVTGTNTYTYCPGVMEIAYIPGIGRSADNLSAVNVAARRLYTYVRHANSGSANYDSPDLMLYMLAVSNAYAMYAHLVRAYGVANVYAQKNRYLPDTLLRAMHFDPNEVRSNLANFRYGINVLAAKLNQLAAPNDMPIFRRATWLNTNVFMDSTTIKSQIYLYSPVGYYVFNEKTSMAGGFLQWNTLPMYSLEVDDWDLSKGVLSTNEWLSVLNAQIQPLLESEDIGIMAGDILKAYGSDKLLSVAQVGESYVVTPTPADLEVLTQIQNTTMVSTGRLTGDGNKFEILGTGNLNITQDPNTGAILYQPRLAAPSRFIDYRKVLTIRLETPLPADIMVASRNTVAGIVPDQDPDLPYELIGYGTEIVRHAIVWNMGNRRNQDTNEIITGPWPTWVPGYLQNLQDSTTVTNQMMTSLKNTISVLSDLSKFDWHMPLYATSLDTKSNAEALHGIACDWDNSTTVGKEELGKLHDAALLSMFNVPALAGNYS